MASPVRRAVRRQVTRSRAAGAKRGGCSARHRRSLASVRAGHARIAMAQVSRRPSVRAASPRPPCAAARARRDAHAGARPASDPAPGRDALHASGSRATIRASDLRTSIGRAPPRAAGAATRVRGRMRGLNPSTSTPAGRAWEEDCDMGTRAGASRKTRPCRLPSTRPGRLDGHERRADSARSTTRGSVVGGRS